MDNKDFQTLVVQLPADLAREASRLADSGRGYESFSEFVAISLRNQLTLELGTEPGDGQVGAQAPGSPGSVDIFAMPPHRDLGLAERASQPPAALSPFTNRLFPIKLASRAAANLATGETWPKLPDFRRHAAQAARDLGLRLRHDDDLGGRRGAARRWIALPVGSDRGAASRRFAAHFTIDLAADGRILGPMGDLGLANVAPGGNVQLTELGWTLARAPSPLLGEAGGHTLSAEEQDVFFEALRGNECELAKISEFIGLLEGTKEQATLDALLADAHPELSDTAVRSHRAAMLGRLGDLGLATVEGRGPSATVLLGGEIPAVLGGERG